MLDPLFFFISRLNIACFPYEFNLQINYQIGIKDISDLKTLDCDILNPDWLINLEINNTM